MRCACDAQPGVIGSVAHLKEMANRCRGKFGHDQHANPSSDIARRTADEFRRRVVPPSNCCVGIATAARTDPLHTGPFRVGARQRYLHRSPDAWWWLSPSGAACLMVSTDAVGLLSIKRVV